jgi:hypothetical protein
MDCARADDKDNNTGNATVQAATANLNIRITPSKAIQTPPGSDLLLLVAISFV